MSSERRWFARCVGYGTLVVAGVWGLALGLEIARTSAGAWGLVVASAFFPVTLAAAPWYALLMWKTWLPVLVVYGGGCVATLLVTYSTPPDVTS